MPVTLFRVDNRLVHGQVLECWVPRLKADAVLVIDDKLSRDDFQKSLLEGMGQGGLEVRVAAPSEAAELLGGAWGSRKVVVLFRGVEEAAAAYGAGVKFQSLNLGNVHPRPGSHSVSPSVQLTGEDESTLARFSRDGVAVDVRAVPSEISPELDCLCCREPKQ